MAILVDRVSERPGRVQICPEDGSAAFYAEVKRADEPLVEGVKINAQNVIDTLLPLSENRGVGTVVFSAVQNPDERWLLCDGSEVREGDYPELYAVLPEVVLRAPSVTAVKLGEYDIEGAVRLVNGYYVTTAHGYLYYTKDPKSEWEHTESVAFYATDNELYDLLYVDGYYVALGYGKTASSKYGPFVYYATELAGPWTRSWYKAGSSQAQIPTRLLYRDGEFCVVYVTNGGYIYTATTSDLTGSWEEALFSTGYSTTLPRPKLEYSQTGGRWELCFCATMNSSVYAFLFASKDLQTWEQLCEPFNTFTGAGGEEVSMVNAPYPCGLGIGESYWNLTGSLGVVRLAADGSWVEQDAVIAAAIEGRGNVDTWAVYCDGRSELAFERGKALPYGRLSADEPFVEQQEAAYQFDASDHNDGGPLGDDRIFIVPRSNASGYAIVIDGLGHTYVPEITVPDDTGIVKAYIKAW